MSILFSPSYIDVMINSNFFAQQTRFENDALSQSVLSVIDCF